MKQLNSELSETLILLLSQQICPYFVYFIPKFCQILCRLFRKNKCLKNFSIAVFPLKSLGVIVEIQHPN